MTAGASDRLRCVVVATWYASPGRPIDGVFVRETARAVSLRHDVAVVHAVPGGPWSDRVEHGLRTVRVGLPPVTGGLAALGAAPRRRTPRRGAGPCGGRALAGVLPRAEVAGLLRRADVFALASYVENLPVAVIETQACGLPVVATRVGGRGRTRPMAARPRAANSLAVSSGPGTPSFRGRPRLPFGGHSGC